MNKIKNLINQLKAAWRVPRKGIHQGEETPFKLSCEFSKESIQVPRNYPFKIPQDLKKFWSRTEEATLFIDKEYGQWGRGK